MRTVATLLVLPQRSVRRRCHSKRTEARKAKGGLGVPKEADNRRKVDRVAELHEALEGLAIWAQGQPFDWSAEAEKPGKL